MVEEPSHLKAGYHEETDSEDELSNLKKKMLKKMSKKKKEKEKKNTDEGMIKKSVKAGHCEETDSEIDVKEDIDALVETLTYLKNLNKKLLQSLEMQLTLK